MDLTPKQQTSEAIRQAETILITTGQHPSVDQISAVIGLSMILTKFGKKVSPVISDGLPQSVQMLETANIERALSGMRDFVLKLDVSKAEVDKLRYEVIDNKLQIFITPFKGGFAPSDVTFDYGASHYDLAIVLGVPTRARIDRVYEQNMSTFEQMPMINLDFHRSNENYGAVNLIEPNASSLCEMLVALAESLQGGILDADIATALLMGIVASTDRFTASHTTSKSLTVAAQMMAAGARQQAVVKALYREGRGDSRSGDQPRGERGGRERGQVSERSNDSTRDGNNQREGGGSPRERDNSGREQVRDRDSQPRERDNSQRGGQAQASSRSSVAQPTEARQPVAEERAPVAANPAGVASAVVAPTSTPAPVSAPAVNVHDAVPVVQSPAAVQFERSPRAEVVEASDLPIIQPGHIELSDFEEEQSAPATEQIPAQAPPMADFAAAAAQLTRQPDSASDVSATPHEPRPS